jgi:CheY-like chemotaxis protein
LTARILVIEDNPANMELMVYLLNAFGHASLCAQNGITGLQLALQESPDLVICDVHLPLLDGYAVVRQIRSNPRLHHLPVVAVTALAMVGDREKLLAAGFNGYISKPIEPEMFVETIEQFLPAPLPVPVPQNGSHDESRTRAHREGRRATRATRMLVLSESEDIQRCVATGMEPFPVDIVTTSSITDAESQLQQGGFDLALIADGPEAEQLRHRLAAINADTSSGNRLPVLILQSSESAEIVADQIQACLQGKNRSPDGDHIDR